jgi:transposase InsO family protein
MGQEKPKVYTAEFKESVVRLANESSTPITQAASLRQQPIRSIADDLLGYNAVSELPLVPRGYTLKIQLIHHQAFHSREEAKQAVFEYIEVFYNRERLHSANGYVSSVDFELPQNAA